MKYLKKNISKAMLISIMLYAPNTMAQNNEKWYLLTDQGVEIPVNNNLYLSKTKPTARTFSIKKLNLYGQEEILARKVRKITFIKKASTDINKIDGNTTDPKLSLERGILTVTNLQPKETISLFSSTGVKITDEQADAQGELRIYTTNIIDGVYILKTSNNNIKFVKE